jgi:hypothetical protein
MNGGISMHVLSAGTDSEHVVVTHAPGETLISELMAGMWLSGEARHLDVDTVRRRFTFGTAGEGVGRVTYELGGMSSRWGNPSVRQGGNPGGPWYRLKRVA